MRVAVVSHVRGQTKILVVYELREGIAAARVGGDLRVMNEIVRALQVARGVTPENGYDFLLALLQSYPESTSSFYGAPTAIHAA